MFEDIVSIVWLAFIALAFFVLALLACAIIYAIRHLKNADAEARLDALEAAMTRLAGLEEKKKENDDVARAD